MSVKIKKPSKKAKNLETTKMFFYNHLANISTDQIDLFSQSTDQSKIY